MVLTVCYLHAVAAEQQSHQYVTLLFVTSHLHACLPCVITTELQCQQQILTFVCVHLGKALFIERYTLCNKQYAI
jgi:hypothetical protein